MSFVSFAVRRSFGKNDRKRDKNFTTPDSIARYDNILYGTRKRWQILDVYRRKDLEHEKLPVIVNVHGGGWVYGSKERYQYYCMDLADRGFAVVNFTYRLAPEFKYPAPIKDTGLVIEWIFKNAGEYCFDTDNVFAVGDSAGAHILAQYSEICTNPEYAGKFKIAVPGGFVFRAMALNCGVYHVKVHDGKNDMTAALMRDYMPDKGTKEELNEINVYNYITGNFPPSFIMSCPGDFLVDEAKSMDAALSDKGVPHELHIFGDETNKLYHVFHLNISANEAKECNDMECSFFRKLLI